MYIEDSDDERHMWKLSRLLHLLEHWHLLLSHNEHVYHSISLLALVDLHRLSICLDGWCLVLLHNWDINDRDVLDQRDLCLLHIWHIDNFVEGLCLSLHWDLECNVLQACAATRSRSRRSDMDVKYGCRDSA